MRRLTFRAGRALPGREALLLAAVTMLGAAVLVDFGEMSMRALDLLVVAGLLVALSTRASPAPAPPAAWAVAVAACAALGLLQVGHLHAPLLAAPLLVLAVTGGMAAWARTPRGALPCLATSSVALAAAVAVPWRWGFADIDVFQSVSNAAARVLHGQNPYDATFVGNDAVAAGDHVVAAVMHYQYGPALALLAAPFRALGDVRLLSVVATAVLVAAAWVLARRGSLREGLHRPLALALAMPLTIGIVQFAWVDAEAMAGFAAWLALRHRHRGVAVVCLAAAMAVKPTVAVALLPFVVWSAGARRETVAAVVIDAIVVLPFALATGPAQLYHDVIGVQAALHPRYDGLALNSYLHSSFGVSLPGWVGVAVTATVCVLVLRRRPRDTGDLCLAGAAISLVSFAFAKWAYFNYYYITETLLVLAVAARGVAVGAPGDTVLPLPSTAVRWLAARRLLPAPAAQPSTVPAAGG